MRAGDFDLSTYCKRIGYAGSGAPDLETLRGLNQAHALRIPYENLEIHLGRPMSLDLKNLYQMMVLHRRGGYCFQMNLLFARALEAMGFDVTLCFGRVWLTSRGETPPPAHLVLRVRIASDGWLADTGFGGGGLRLPVLLRPGEETTQAGRSYRLGDAGRFGTMLERLEGEKWIGLYSFDTTPREPVDFVHSNYFLSTSPDSFFVRNRACAIATEEGETTLLNDTLRVRVGAETQVQKLADGPTYLTALREHFGIDLPAGTAFRPTSA